MQRRRFILGSAAVAGIAYSMHRGLRYPPLSFDPGPLGSTHSSQEAQFKYTNLLATESSNNQFRAYAPHFSLEVAPSSAQALTILVDNVPSLAELKFTADKSATIDEEVFGSKRKVRMTSSNPVSLSWDFPKDRDIPFAVIGDTGANLELDACLHRASEMDAQFLLHLGDFNYLQGEYALAVEKFNNGAIPCYVSIGNHDFHHKGIIYHLFREQIGPMNNAFEVNGVRFLNLDTAADYFPASSGQRGKLLANKTNPQQRQVVFTHRPLKDPRPHDDHEIGGVGEIKWLTQTLNYYDDVLFLNGHVHHSAEFELEGIRQYTVGEGLGHEDIVLQRKVARFLMGMVHASGEVSLNWQPLNIPWLAHQSGTHLEKLKRDGRTRQLAWFSDLLQAKAD